MKILCVDDDVHVLAYMQVVVEHAGHQFLGAECAKSCLEMVGEHNPSIIFLDVAMPDADGFEALARVRKIHPSFKGHVWFLSIHKRPEFVKKAGEVGAKGYVLKPISTLRLLHCIREASIPSDAEASTPIGRDIRDETVLCVDDDVHVLEYMRIVIESAGHVFIGADSGQRCLDIMRERRPTVIFLDVEMAGMDGFDTLTKMRKRYPTFDGQVWFLSVHKNGDFIRRAGKTDAKGYILKPLSALRLLNCIRIAVEEPRTLIGISP